MIVGMRLFPLFIFLTLVGSGFAVEAAPSTAPARPGFSEPSSAPEVQDPTKIETIQAAPAGEPPADLPVRERIVRTATPPSGFSVHVGFLGGQILEREDNKQSGLLGVQWSHAFPHDKVWDFQFDVGSDAWLRIGTGRKFFFSRDTQYRPYWKLALFQTTESSRVFAGFADLERVKLVAALGLDDLLEQEQTMNVEFGAGWGMKGAVVQLQLGWAI